MAGAIARCRLAVVVVLGLAACAEGSGDHAMRAAAVNAGDGRDAALPSASSSVVVLGDAGPRVRQDVDATLIDAGAALGDGGPEAGLVDGAVPDAMEPLPMFVSDGAVRAGSGGIGGSGGAGGIGGGS